MGIGSFRKRGKIQKQIVSNDGRVASWVDVGNVWVEIRAASASAIVSVSNLSKRLTHVLRVRYREDVCVGMRIVCGVRVFVIRSVVDRHEKRCWIEMAVEEGGEV